MPFKSHYHDKDGNPLKFVQVKVGNTWHPAHVLEGSDDGPCCTVRWSSNGRKEVVKASAIDFQLNIGKRQRRKTQQRSPPKIRTKAQLQKMKNIKAGNEGDSFSGQSEACNSVLEMEAEDSGISISDDEAPLSAMLPGKRVKEPRLEIDVESSSDDDAPIASMKTTAKHEEQVLESPPSVQRKRRIYVVDDSDSDSVSYALAAQERSRASNKNSSGSRKNELRDSKKSGSGWSKTASKPLCDAANAWPRVAENSFEGASKENKLQFGPRRDNRPAWLARKGSEEEDDEREMPKSLSKISAGWSSPLLDGKKAAAPGWGRTLVLSNQGSLGSASAVSLAAESEFRSEAAVSAPPCGLGASGALVPSFSSWGVGAQANEKGSNKIQETAGWNDSSPGSALKKVPSFSWAKKFSLEGGKQSSTGWSRMATAKTLSSEHGAAEKLLNPIKGNVPSTPKSRQEVMQPALDKVPSNWPAENDVVKSTPGHPGTARYGELLNFFVGDSAYHTYPFVAKNILSRLRSMDPPGRIFIKAIKGDCLWETPHDAVKYIVRDLSALYKSNKKKGVVMPPSGKVCGGGNESGAGERTSCSQRDDRTEVGSPQFDDFPAPLRKQTLPSGKRAKDLCLLPTEVTVPVERDSEDHDYFLKWLWGEKLLIREHKLRNHTCLEMEFTKHGTRYTLIVTKKFESKSMRCAKFDVPWIRAYYIALDEGEETFKKKFDKLGNFGKLDLNKVVSRFELMVSPAMKGPGKASLHYALDKDDFEMIDENYNDGCGFISALMIRDVFGLDPTIVCALQVRIMCPKLGWFKGMLMVKPKINRIQLPSSLKKVEKSLTIKSNDDDYDWAYVLIKQTFPSRNSKTMWQILNPYLGDPCRTALKNLKDTKIGNVLLNIGIPNDVFEDYMHRSNESIYDHKHASCVGVSDPTDSLPKGTILVTGLGRASTDIDVVITRNPNTEKDDVKVLQSIRQKPRGMSKEHWDFLFSLPFGLVIFASPSDGSASIPESIAAGDLDGDLYHIFWDDAIVQSITHCDISLLTNESTGYNDELMDSDEEIPNISNSNEPIASKILNHRGKGGKVCVQIKWKDRPKPTWEPVTRHLREDQDWRDMLVEYAIENKLSSEFGWGWTAFGINDICISNILGHTDRPLNVIVKWDNGQTESIAMDDMRNKWEAGELVAEYGSRNNLLNRKHWNWAKAFDPARKDWFERAQELLSKAYLVYEHDRLRTSLHTIFQNQKRQWGRDDKNVIALGRAYKQSNDILKHGGKIDIPLHMHRLIKEDALHKHLNYYDIEQDEKTKEEMADNEESALV